MFDGVKYAVFILISIHGFCVINLLKLNEQSISYLTYYTLFTKDVSNTQYYFISKQQVRNLRSLKLIEFLKHFSQKKSTQSKFKDDGIGLSWTEFLINF